MLTFIGGVCVADSYWWSLCCSQLLVESVLLTVIGGVCVADSYWWSLLHQ
jgi:hypothetical protein